MPFLLALLLLVGGCSLVRMMAGANIDQEQFAKAREAKILEVRHNAATALLRRLSNGDPLDNADLTVSFSESFINNVANQYVGTTGWLDAETSYTIDSVRVELVNGSAVATLGMKAFNTGYDVAVDLNMDCLIKSAMEGDDLSASLEPFNIAPKVKAGGLLAEAEDIIRDVIRIKLGRMNDDFPPMKLPLDVKSVLPIDGASIGLRRQINMNVLVPRRVADYTLSLKEVLVFDDHLFVALNLKTVGVK